MLMRDQHAPWTPFPNKLGDIATDASKTGIDKDAANHVCVHGKVRETTAPPAQPQCGNVVMVSALNHRRKVAATPSTSLKPMGVMLAPALARCIFEVIACPAGPQPGASVFFRDCSSRDANSTRTHSRHDDVR